MKFEYKRPEDIKIEAYGKVFEVPPKTSVLIDTINKVSKKMSVAGVSAAEQVTALREGIAAFIGEENAEAIFPTDKLHTANSDEMSAFWFTLNEVSNKETERMLEKYAPKSAEKIKEPSIPKK